MRCLGIVVHVLENYGLYIIHIGLGQLRYCKSNMDIKVGEIIVCIASEDDSSDVLCLEYLSKLSDYYHVGNINSGGHLNNLWQVESRPLKVIARRESFALWEQCGTEWAQLNEYRITEASNALLFRLYAKNRYSKKTEEEILQIYLKAKEKVNSFDIREIINGLKVNIENNSFTSRGSDNYLTCWTTMSSWYGYEVFGDKYFEGMFPSIEIELYRYSEKNEEETYNSDYPIRSEWPQIAKQKECEMKKLALDIYEKRYTKDAHINYLVCHKIEADESSYRADEKNIFNMIGKSEIYWDGYFFESTIKKLRDNPAQFIEIIMKHNINQNSEAQLSPIRKYCRKGNKFKPFY
jgi:hypothetical protein